MKAPNENFHHHLDLYCADKSLIPDTRSDFYNNALDKFKNYSESFQSVMPYKYFVENIIGDKTQADAPLIFSTFKN